SPIPPSTVSTNTSAGSRQRRSQISLLVRSITYLSRKNSIKKTAKIHGTPNKRRIWFTRIRSVRFDETFDSTTARGPDMKRFLTAVVMAISLTPLGAFAQERVGDAALGGLSGAIVFGPVGAVAGIVVGYAAGPGISRSWGLKRSDSR